MISNEYKKVGIENIGGGVLKELFERELEKVCENIDDINTNAKDTRVITLKISIKPSEDRSTGDISVKAASSLAGVKAHCSTIHLPKLGEKRTAYIHDVKQGEFDLTQPTPITTKTNGGDSD